MARRPPPPGEPLDDVLTFRDRPSVQGTVRTLMNDANLHVRFETGPLQHHVVAGVELDREEAALTRFANQLNVIPGTPILDPDPYEPFPGHQTQVTQTPDTVTKTASGLVEDSIDFGSHWELTGAVRVDRFNANYNEPITRQHYEHTDTISSPTSLARLQANRHPEHLRFVRHVLRSIRGESVIIRHHGITGAGERPDVRRLGPSRQWPRGGSPCRRRFFRLR